MKKKPTPAMGALDIAEILDLTVPVPFKYQPKGTDQTYVVNQLVYVERITANLIDEISEASEKSEAEALQRIISQTVKSWDIVLGGEPLGTDLETLKKLPMTFLAASAEALIALWQGRPTKEPNSQNTSEQVESPALSPAGTE